MKVRAVVEAEVPDEVGAKLLADQAEWEKRGDEAHFETSIYMGQWTYRMKAPMRWENVPPVEDDPDA